MLPKIPPILFHELFLFTSFSFSVFLKIKKRGCPSRQGKGPDVPQLHKQIEKKQHSYPNQNGKTYDPK
jgi:hypothetical protein